MTMRGIAQTPRVHSAGGAHSGPVAVSHLLPAGRRATQTRRVGEAGGAKHEAVSSQREAAPLASTTPQGLPTSTGAGRGAHFPVVRLQKRFFSGSHTSLR